ncbi:energy-coupling factor ABC transporter ATP-binding protein [Thermodesulfobacteriota bacterium]
MDKNHLLIDLDDISFSYPGGRPVLENLCLQLNEKERVGLIGPNGSGKTTLFHIIMGLLKPSSGSIEIFGKKVRDKKDFRPVRQQIGLLFQDADDQLFSPTVLEDVAFGPLNQGRSISEARDIARETLSTLGLDGFENRITYRLSGGEKKLVSLATVLAMKPKVLLLDEPTTGLDSETTKKIIDVVERIDISYIFISHNMDFINRTTDKICGISNARIFLEKEKVPHSHIHAHGYGQMPHIHSDSDEINPRTDLEKD